VACFRNFLPNVERRLPRVRRGVELLCFHEADAAMASRVDIAQLHWMRAVRLVVIRKSARTPHRAVPESMLNQRPAVGVVAMAGTPVFLPPMFRFVASRKWLAADVLPPAATPKPSTRNIG
jgi:hypothetical protein